MHPGNPGQLFFEMRDGAERGIVRVEEGKGSLHSPKSSGS